MSTSIGYSMVNIDNSDGQADNAFKHGDYALVNLLFTPVKNVMFGPEVQYGRRENFRDGFTSDDLRVQFSFKYSFSQVHLEEVEMSSRCGLFGLASLLSMFAVAPAMAQTSRRIRFRRH